MNYDLVIIGGGIHGVGIAQAGAAAGHRVLLLEKASLAHGSSSRSSKLVHGGLRYLEHGQLRLVRECLRERDILLKIAPDLVRLVPFHIPVYQDSRRQAWQIRAGLGLYALLAGAGPVGRFARLPQAAWSSLDGLRHDGLLAVFRYQDAQTDDAALTRAVMRSAVALGAELAMPARFSGARLEGDGCSVAYWQGERRATCRTRVLVNAAGPWAAEVLAQVEPQLAPPAVDLVRGTHLVLPGRLTQGAYYLEAPQDGRAVFALPHCRNTLVGTTEVLHEGLPDAVAPTPAERAYLHEVIGHYFPRWRSGEPLSQFAGLRVLPRVPDRPFARSRETVLQVDRRDRPRLVSVLGGKLTTYRASAAKCLQELAAVLPRRAPRGDTRTLPLRPD